MTMDVTIRVGFTPEGTVQTLARALQDEFFECRDTYVDSDELVAALHEWREHIDDAPPRWAWTAMAMTAGAFDRVDTTDEEWCDAVFAIATERVA
nr:hypothetical protein [Corynebacterium lactis]